MSLETIVPPRSGIAFRLGRGRRFRIEDLEGQQVSDLVVFLAADPTERLSQANTRKLNGTWLISAGHVLYSTRCRPLLRITADTVGRHDLQSSMCSPYDYPIRFGVEGHPSCLAILRDQLAPHGVPEHLIPDPLNVFMATTIDPDSGAIEVEAPRSKPGDHIEFEALEGCLVALTACPQDMNQCNGGRITSLRVTAEA
jgi:uncharacterized protein YcgI (DUF1989 family)